VIQAAARVLAAEELLLRSFAAGVAPGELARALKISPPAATRCLRTLAQAGRAERIPETDRWRASHRLGRLAIQAVNAIDRAIADLGESRQRLDPDRSVSVRTY
jgi:DNA-binding IclR family transcriptional regulator